MINQTNYAVQFCLGRDALMGKIYWEGRVLCTSLLWGD